MKASINKLYLSKLAIFTVFTDGRAQCFKLSFREAVQIYSGTYGRRHLGDGFNAVLRQQSKTRRHYQERKILLEYTRSQVMHLYQFYLFCLFVRCLCFVIYIMVVVPYVSEHRVPFQEASSSAVDDRV